ncbi:MAG: DsbA family oxidoreductase [Pseudomonadota bacterium]
MDVLVYSDFNCPFCYVLNERLIAAGVAQRAQWRGVQHAPQLPMPLAAAGPRLRAELQHEVSAVRHLAPEVEIALPSGKPNTGPAIAAVAAVLRVDAHAAHVFKDSLYRAFWREGADLSDPAVLRALARAAGLPEQWDGAEVAATAARWQNEWIRSGFRGVPAMLRGDGQRLEGLVPLQKLQTFFAE